MWCIHTWKKLYAFITQDIIFERYQNQKSHENEFAIDTGHFEYRKYYEYDYDDNDYKTYKFMCAICTSETLIPTIIAYNGYHEVAAYLKLRLVILNVICYKCYKNRFDNEFDKNNKPTESKDLKIRKILYDVEID